MWILDNGLWLDIGIWDDADFWQDYPVAGVVVAADGGSYELTGTPATLLVAPVAVRPPFGGGIVHEPPRPIFGVGYGILPPLWGEAFGVVGAAGRGAASLPDLKVFAAAVAGASGQSRAQFTIRAAAIGAGGNAGTAAGHIDKLKAAGIITHDDDAAVAIKFLLDA